jgi:hypothetical protein
MISKSLTLTAQKATTHQQLISSARTAADDIAVERPAPVGRSSSTATTTHAGK